LSVTYFDQETITSIITIIIYCLNVGVGVVVVAVVVVVVGGGGGGMGVVVVVVVAVGGVVGVVVVVVAVVVYNLCRGPTSPQNEFSHRSVSVQFIHCCIG
jgi:hypothetical protein